jgi:hypothetical protein
MKDVQAAQRDQPVRIALGGLEDIVVVEAKMVLLTPGEAEDNGHVHTLLIHDLNELSGPHEPGRRVLVDGRELRLIGQIVLSGGSDLGRADVHMGVDDHGSPFELCFWKG